MMLSNTLQLKVLKLKLNIHIPDKTELVDTKLMKLNLKTPDIMMLNKMMQPNYKLLLLWDQSQLPLKLINKVSNYTLVVYIMMLVVEFH